MSNQIDDGGKAFPLLMEDGMHNSGMTLRDWFAGQALGECIRWHNEAVSEGVSCLESSEVPARSAADAYIIADAMLKARAINDPPAAQGGPYDPARFIREHGTPKRRKGGDFA